MHRTEDSTVAHRPRPFTWRRMLLAALAVVILVLVFAAYLQPAFVLDLANRFILCL